MGLFLFLSIIDLLLSDFRVIYIHKKRGKHPKEREENKMKTIIELDGRKISKKAASEKFGKEEMDRMIREAKKAFAEDPLEETSWWMGEGMLSITFR